MGQITADKIALSQQITCSPTQACAALGIGKTALYALLADGSLRSIKLGKARLIIVQSIHDWIADMESYGIGQLGEK